MTILGTRPEIIRLSRVIAELDYITEHILVHTGQNFDRTLSDIFFEELGIRKPNYLFDSKAETPMQQIGKILAECERVLLSEKPNRILILGDTNSALSAIVAKRIGIPVFHMEAGNRCYDDRVPEELNRRLVDHSSDILMPYTERSRANLLREGIDGSRIYVTGNPILEVLNFYETQITASNSLENLRVEPKKYFLITLHRAENVDVSERLEKFITALERLWKIYHYPIICSLHPRTRSQLQKQGKTITHEGIIVIEPLGLFDFVRLEKEAFCVLSDSGTVQEECAIFNVPNVTLRDVTERPETLEVGSNFIAGSESETIIRAVKAVTSRPSNWEPPPEYLATGVSRAVTNIILSYWR
jgi:UDP-N-acetylglucosamine 2-epimerase (non-hydrolysing)